MNAVCANLVEFEKQSGLALQIARTRIGAICTEFIGAFIANGRAG
jgi:hypothetical protein